MAGSYGLIEVSGVLAAIESLDAMCKAGGFGWVMLMVTDVMKGNSVLLSSDKAKYERKLSYVALGEHIYDMPGVLSRKKQLLPEILHAVG